MEKERVIIVGAGIAGLTLARQLIRHFDVTVLEAQDRAGGRIHTIMVSREVVERGAEFVHGRLPETFALAREAGLSIVPVRDKMYRRVNGVLSEESEMDPHWDEMLDKMQQLEEDMTLNEFLQLYFNDDKYSALRQGAIGFAGGFDLADAGKASVKALYREWSADEEPNFRITEGYGSLISFLLKKSTDDGAAIHFNQAVTEIKPYGRRVVAATSNDEKFEGSAIVVTVPVGPLSRGSITFGELTPAITARMNAIGMGVVIRFVFGFRKQLWPPDTGFLFSQELVPTWWTGSGSGPFQLTGWAGGPAAGLLSGKGEDELVEVALGSLSVILGMSTSIIREEIIFHVITDWSVHPWSDGGYSYATPATLMARQELAKPVEGRIWFAGEGFSMGPHPSTVEASIVHAKEVGEKIRAALTA